MYEVCFKESALLLLLMYYVLLVVSFKTCYTMPLCLNTCFVYMFVQYVAFIFILFMHLHRKLITKQSR
jgi:hypothetical protein